MQTFSSQNPRDPAIEKSIILASRHWCCPEGVLLSHAAFDKCHSVNVPLKPIVSIHFTKKPCSPWEVIQSDWRGKEEILADLRGLMLSVHFPGTHTPSPFLHMPTKAQTLDSDHAERWGLGEVIIFLVRKGCLACRIFISALVHLRTDLRPLSQNHITQHSCPFGSWRRRQSKVLENIFTIVYYKCLKQRHLKWLLATYTYLIVNLNETIKPQVSPTDCTSL